MKSELERMNSENQRLKEMLNEATHNYNGLQMHLHTIMQKGVAEKGKTKNIFGNRPSTHKQSTDLGMAAATNANDLAASDNEIGGEGNQNKFPNHSVDEATEATIRKARVSVRARCEDPMV